MTFSENDINEEIIDYVDKYFKTVIINTKINYLKNINRNHKYGITFVSIEDLQEKSEWTTLDEFEKCNLKLKDETLDISFSNMALATAIDELPELQKTILLRNVVLEIPLEYIATEIGVSLSTVKRNKYRAIKSVKKRMKLINEGL